MNCKRTILTFPPHSPRSPWASTLFVWDKKTTSPRQHKHTGLYSGNTGILFLTVFRQYGHCCRIVFRQHGHCRTVFRQHRHCRIVFKQHWYCRTVFRLNISFVGLYSSNTEIVGLYSGNAGIPGLFSGNTGIVGTVCVLVTQALLDCTQALQILYCRTVFSKHGHCKTVFRLKNAAL